MWFLMMVLLNLVPGFQQNTVLNTFATFEECRIERNRIGFDMAASYPYDGDFRLECQYRASRTRPMPAHTFQGEAWSQPVSYSPCTDRGRTRKRGSRGTAC